MNSAHKQNKIRRREILAHPQLNGIDFLEVLDLEISNPEWWSLISQTKWINLITQENMRQRWLVIFFMKPLGSELLSRFNFRIEGGKWIKNLQVLDAIIEPAGQFALILVDQPGDFSEYTLCVIRDRHSEKPPENFDRLLSRSTFSFKAECSSEFDCKSSQQFPKLEFEDPPIDYLTKDYAGFKRLMLDRLSALIPDWKEKSPADIGMTIVELLAYSADHLSYYQDAVATEAYLGTARKRISVKRHARLLDYSLHEGCNARTWISFEVEATADGAVLPTHTPILTNIESAGVTLTREEMSSIANNADVQIFETMAPIELRQSKNNIPFYTWGETRDVLPVGATNATLSIIGDGLELKKGDVLILEELICPKTNLAVNADPEKRHAVRLDRAPVYDMDNLYNTKIMEIGWHQEDALPFELAIGRTVDGDLLSIARANVVLADQGYTIENEDIDPPEVSVGETYRPNLQSRDITWYNPLDIDPAKNDSAQKALKQNPDLAIPAVMLIGNGETWTAKHQLLNSDRFANEFVLEMNEEGKASLRFGDNVMGKRPAEHTRFKATYRIGNGVAGNIGRDSLVHVVTDLDGIISLSNLLPGVGGSEPETINHAKIHAPRAFTRQKRAVTEQDYAITAELHPEVQKAQAQLRWTGSWHTVNISVDRLGGRSVDFEFIRELQDFIEPYRFSGHDLEIKEPQFVALHVSLRLMISDEYLRSTVYSELLEVFSRSIRANGQSGFFHPDNFTFGQPVYLSNIVSTAMDVKGVEWVEPVVFTRFEAPTASGLTSGVIKVGNLEIIRLDNDPAAPENGRIDFYMEGGL